MSIATLEQSIIVTMTFASFILLLMPVVLEAIDQRAKRKRGA